MSHKIASLPWYDLREIRHATDALWLEFARQFRLAGLPGIPERLNRELPYEHQWTSPEFFFGQACGYDVHIAYANELVVVATPWYRVAGCEGSNYSSFVVVRDDSPYEVVEDLRDTRCVINTPTSHSGMNVLRALVAPLHCEGRFFSDVRTSGSHERSLRMIQHGIVDVAAIDCVTHALLARYRPVALAGSRILHRTEHVPAPPYVTGAGTSRETVAAMRSAIQRTFHEPSVEAAKEALLLADVEVLAPDAYRTIESLASMARDHSYNELPGCALATVQS